MYCKTLCYRVLSFAMTLAAAALVIIALGQMHLDTATGATLFNSPLTTPSLLFSSPLPTPTPKPVPSDAARKAIAHIAKREGIPIESLDIVADHRSDYPALGRQFQVVTMLDTRPQGQVYKLLVDLRNGRVEEDISALLVAEARAHQSRYGKLQPTLYERLQGLKDDDTLPVAIWMATSSGKSLAEQQATAFAALAAKYPQARAAIERGGKPMDVSDPELRQRIEADYTQ